MNKIIISTGSDNPKDMVLEHGFINIGRAKDNEIHLSDETLSGHHARIVTIFTASHVEDLGSTNGTFVNNKKVEKHTLHDGDVITVGQCRIEFITDVANREVFEEKTVLMSDEKLQSMLAEAEAKKSTHQAASDLSMQSVEQAPLNSEPVEENTSKPNVPDSNELHETHFNPEQANASIYQPEDTQYDFSHAGGQKNKKGVFYIGVVVVVLVAFAVVYALLGL